jgi:peptidoglycan/LPS O-acetylase OafA/YrhL
VTPAYRSDIDGLRGIAVLAVVFYHFGTLGFTGGYVGVDVFFVVSGYLITGIVLREIQNNELSLARFYERRIRRIFPALFVTVGFTLTAAAVLFTPLSFENVGRSAVAVALFASNVMFWKDTGYFDAPAGHKPLLHTWSLSVEEQFYILYPVLLSIAWRVFPSTMVRCLVVIASISLALSVYMVAFHPEAAYYWAPTRAWELLLGGLIICANPTSLSRRSRSAVAALGLSAIAASVLLFDSSTSFPGAWAILPTAGTAAILYAGPERTSAVGRLLTNQLLVGVGLISYSLYLLHWPLLVLAQQLAIVDLTVAQKAALLVVTFLLATASWRWVELPFRSRQYLSRRQVFVGGACAMSLAGVAGLMVAISGGFPERFETEPRPQLTTCNFRLPDEAHGLCTLGGTSSPATFLLWGDSHARALSTALSESASRQSRTGQLAFGAGCPPLIMPGPPKRSLRFGPNSPQCRQFNQRMLEHIQAHRELTTIVLVARWVRYGEVGGDVAEFSPALKRTVSALSALGRRAVIVNQVPEVEHDVPEAYRMARMTGRNLNDILAPTRETYANRNRRVLAAFDALQREGAPVIDLRDRLCDNSRCRILDSGRLLYADDNHLSDYGARYVSLLFDPILAAPVAFASR